MDKHKLLEKLDAAWQDLLASHAGMTGAEMQQPGVVGEWSVKEVIAHITSWEEEALTHLPTILAGRRPPKYSVKYGGIDAFNAQMTEQKKNLSLSDVLQQQDDTHRRLIDYVQRAPEEQFTGETRLADAGLATD